MRKYGAAALIAAALMIGGGGCANLRALTRADQMERQARADRVEFFQKMSDAYRILAYEYYQLAAEAEKKKQPDLAKDYAARVALYDAFHKQARKDADELRGALQSREGFELPPLPPAAGAPAPGAPPAETQRAASGPAR